VLSISSLLVVFETALCLVLLSGAGLMIRSTVNLYGASIGANTSNVLTMKVNLPEAKYPRPSEQVSFHRLLESRVESLPGVENSGAVSNLPMGGWTSFSYQLEGTPLDLEREPQSNAIVATPGYFRVMRVRPSRGRLFTDSDGLAGAPVVVVNESFADKFWPGENPLGKRLRLIKQRTPQPWLTVEGIVPDILQNFRHPLQHDPILYLPYPEEPWRETFIVSRTRVPPATMADAFRREVQRIDPNLPVYEVRTLENRLAETRLTTTLLGGMFEVFAGIALVLGSVGVYAVIAHSISQRMQEIGIRMALGATGRQIVELVFAEGLLPLAVGAAIGLPVAFGVTHVLRMGLIGVSPGDPITFLGVVLVLTMAGIFACAVPARRAMRVDAVAALRCD
jgi:putative ABC transport system permease protein